MRFATALPSFVASKTRAFIFSRFANIDSFPIDSDFTVPSCHVQERCVKLTVEQARQFLQSRNNCEVAAEMEILSSGPMIVLCLSRENAIKSWRALMGPENCSMARKSAPTSLRALYGDSKDDMMNAVYGTKEDCDVGHELRFFFPNSKTNENKT